jgi:hypothetical protein
LDGNESKQDTSARSAPSSRTSASNRVSKSGTVNSGGMKKHRSTPAAQNWTVTATEPAAALTPGGILVSSRGSASPGGILCILTGAPGGILVSSRGLVPKNWHAHKFGRCGFLVVFPTTYVCVNFNANSNANFSVNFTTTFGLKALDVQVKAHNTHSLQAIFTKKLV